MKKLLFIAPLFFCMMARSQVKDTVKKVELPPIAAPQRMFYIVLPEASWNRVIQILRKSSYPSTEVDDVVNYFQANAIELKPPTPAADTSKPKK